MSAKGLQVIDLTVEETHIWINELTDRLDWRSHSDVLRLMRGVLRAVRDHLPAPEMAQLSAQLPLLIRGMFYEGWQPHLTPMTKETGAGFVARIEAEVSEVADYRGPEDITTVFKLLNNRISRGEIEDVRANMRTDIKAMWPAP